MGTVKTDDAYEYIKNKILNLEIQPLSSISESEIQKEMNISRTPVRESLLRLEKDGFIYIYPRKGIIVSEVTRDLVDDIFETRLLNEPYINEKASHVLSSARIQALMDSNLEIPSEDPEKKREYLMEYDKNLHLELLSCCGNRFLQRIMSNVYDHTQRIRRKGSHPDMGDDHTTQEHMDILEAMKKRDPQLIRETSILHIQNSKKLILNSLL